MILVACVDFLKKGWTYGDLLESLAKKNLEKQAEEEEEKFKGTAFN